ncbi:MAG TPA: hypothetical protein VGQ24_16745, partial [Gemmatimonadales bacterium]|nr:hypothetical protein [Gemmatimonadales bacterium]
GSSGRFEPLLTAGQVQPLPRSLRRKKEKLGVSLRAELAVRVALAVSFTVTTVCCAGSSICARPAKGFPGTRTNLIPKRPSR